ncbi:MAG: phosphoribosylglycinamide formyltransferase [Chitinivibrionales bacterium]|nr:phosphoribosylglycinamide formyltransferase [Chitinivibrionales bacterium]MBD3356917.1 phosphoribosylglycinamide formyltransferase [Chitinivibrionales bacterium]
MKCAVFASGGGTNFQSLLDKKISGDLHVSFVLVVSNNSRAGALERARKHGIPTLHISPSHFELEADYTKRLATALREHEVDLIILAGYMKMIPAAIVREYRNRIINIHPALLPAFGGKGLYGSRVHCAVLEYGAKVTGVTVHFVDEHYDHGPVILQRTTEVRDGDNPETLAARVLALEHDSYWRAIEAVANGAVTVEGRRVYGIAK